MGTKKSRGLGLREFESLLLHYYLSLSFALLRKNATPTVSLSFALLRKISPALRAVDLLLHSLVSETSLFPKIKFYSQQGSLSREFNEPKR